MDATPDDPDRRQTCLPVMLTILSIGTMLWLLIIATGGWALYLLLMVAGLGLYALFHYALWGGMLSQEVAREREEEQRRQERQEEDWPQTDAERHGRFKE